MVKHYLLAAFRSMSKNKMYSFVNIAGLTLGLWACMLVATLVIDDLSYDRQWSRGNDLYRIVSVNKMGKGLYNRSTASLTGLQEALTKNFPEVEAVAALRTQAGQFKFNETQPNGVSTETLESDTSIWKMLDIDVLEGNPRSFVAGHPNLLISETFRDRFFKGVSPIGKMIFDVQGYGGNDTFLITGVIHDLPANTHLRADVIRIEPERPAILTQNESGTALQQYVLLRPGTDSKQFTKKVNKWYRDFIGSDRGHQFEFQPMRDIYLHSDFAEDQVVRGSARNIYIFSGTALLLLVIACINFVNLSTARSITRLKETGVRKILGAGRGHIVRQMLMETLLCFGLSTLFAISLYQLSLKPVENFLGHPLMVTFTTRLPVLASACGIILLVSLLTGIYPAWLMAGFNPASSLSGRLFTPGSFGRVWLRKSLVVIQFSISIAVLLGMIVVRSQVKFMENKDLGFDKRGLLSIGLVSWEGRGQTFKNELLKLRGVEKASISRWTPSQETGFMSTDINDPDRPGNKIKLWYIAGDKDLAQTLGFHLRSGRFLSNEIVTDGVKWSDFFSGEPRLTCLVSETTARLWHISQLNKTVKVDYSLQPVGVIDDINNESLRQTVGPTIIVALDSMNDGHMLIRVQPGAEKQVLSSLHELWEKFYPGKLLETAWVDDLLERQYENEAKLQQLFLFFSMLTMVLAALGVFGLIVHAAGQRTREIGIRKVLGASAASIVRLLSADFAGLVLIAIVIASPLAAWAMHHWLLDFAYRTTIGWWMFALAGIAALAIALITVGFQALKAALTNPVRALRSE
ncbi:MAG: ABC transporter permease [Puia sp.]|nr:ABC transporter permease [Puia sp.]